MMTKLPGSDNLVSNVKLLRLARINVLHAMLLALTGVCDASANTRLDASRQLLQHGSRGRPSAPSQMSNVGHTTPSLRSNCFCITHYPVTVERWKVRAFSVSQSTEMRDAFLRRRFPEALHASAQSIRCAARDPISIDAASFIRC